MEYREAGRQPAAAAAAVEMSAGSEGEGWYDVVATAARKEPPPLTHDDNRGFLRMLREKKERSDPSSVCGLPLINYTQKKEYISMHHRSKLPVLTDHVARMVVLVLVLRAELMDMYGSIMVIRLGVEAARVEVRFERLTVEADVRVGRRAVPTLLNCAVNAAQVTKPANNAGEPRDAWDPTIPSSSILSLLALFIPMARHAAAMCLLRSLALFLALSPLLLFGCMHCKLQLQGKIPASMIHIPS